MSSCRCVLIRIHSFTSRARALFLVGGFCFFFFNRKIASSLPLHKCALTAFWFASSLFERASKICTPIANANSLRSHSIQNRAQVTLQNVQSMNDLRTVFHLPINDAAKKVRARSFVYKKSVPLQLTKNEREESFFGHTLPHQRPTCSRGGWGEGQKKRGVFFFFLFFFSLVCVFSLQVNFWQKTNQKQQLLLPLLLPYYIYILVGIVRDCSQTEMPRVWHRALAVSQGEEDWHVD